MPGHTTKTEDWLALARVHAPGRRDQPLVDVAQWTADDLRKALGGLRGWRRAAAAGEVEDALLRLAMLHTDLALLAPDLAQQFAGFPEWTTLEAVSTTDGRALGTSLVSSHWRLARVILDEVPRRPQPSPRVLQWYRAVATELLAHRAQAIAMAHLERAARLFPADRDLNLQSGLLHESLAHVAAWELPRGMRTGLDVSNELQAARRAFARAVAADPGHAAAQLHLGRVCHLLGDDEASAAAVSVTLSRATEPAVRYLGELLMGAVYHSARRFDAARASFERAASLFPTAQSPLVALSHVARASGQRSEAVRIVGRLAMLPEDIDERTDPWWDYETGALDGLGSTLDDLREELRVGAGP